MGEEKDGSSSAAQRAHDIDPAYRPGLLVRLAEAFKPTEAMNGYDQEVTDAAASASTRLGLVNLRNKSVEDVAVPRAEIVSVPQVIELDGLVEVFRESGLTRLPVFRDTLDSPVGMIHLKDLSLKHGFNGAGPEFALSAMVRPVLFVPPFHDDWRAFAKDAG